MTKPLVSEKVIQDSIIELLNKSGFFVWRNNVGSVQRDRFSVKTGLWQKTFYMFGKKGLPDIIGCTPSGTFLGIEVKTQSGKVSPEQKETLESLANRGAIAFVARSVADAIKVLGLEAHEIIEASDHLSL